MNKEQTDYKKGYENGLCNGALAGMIFTTLIAALIIIGLNVSILINL